MTRNWGKGRSKSAAKRRRKRMARMDAVLRDFDHTSFVIAGSSLYYRFKPGESPDTIVTLKDYEDALQ